MSYIKFGFIILTSVLIASCWSGKLTKKAQSSPSEVVQLWTDVDVVSIPLNKKPGLPSIYRLLRLDTSLLDVALTKELHINLPMPDNSYLSFKLKETQLLAPALAKKFPNIKTYEGTCLTEPGTSVKIDHSPAGFRAMIRSTKGTFYIDPYLHNRKIYYLSYNKKDLIPSEAPFERSIEPKD